MKKGLHVLIVGTFLLQLFTQPPTVQAATNRTPIANTQSGATNEDTPLVITLTGTDPEGAALTYSISRNPIKGSLSCAGPVCTYTPASNVYGNDFFNFKVNDGSLTSRAATVNITINSVNDAPVGTANSVVVSEDNSVVIVLKASDVERDSLSFQIASQPNLGTISLSSDVATFTPNANAYGNDSFNFVASDGKAVSAPATISLTINAVNDAPTAADQEVITDEDTAIVIPLSVNDAENDPLTVTIGYASTNGTVTVSETTATYVPDPKFSGADSFTYRVSDATTSSGTAAINVTVNAVNDLPTVENTAFEVKSGGTAIVTLSGSDEEGDALTYSIIDAPSHGVTTMTAADTLIYKADNDYSGADSFTFVANDGSAQSAAGMASVKILAADAFTPIFSQALEPLMNVTTTVNGETTVITMASNDCFQTDASPLILPGLDSSGEAIEYAVGILFSTCLNYIDVEGYQYVVRTDTGEAFQLSSVIGAGVKPNAFGSGTFDGNTLVTPLVSTNIGAEDPDAPTGGFLVQQLYEDGTTKTVYHNPFVGRAIPAPVLLIEDILLASTINDSKPTCQRGGKIDAEFCGIWGFIHAIRALTESSEATLAIAFPEDNGYEASYNGAARAIVKNTSDNKTYDRIVWGTGAGGNAWDSMDVGGGCTVNMVKKEKWWEAIAGGTFAAFDFFANDVSLGVKSFDPGDAGCTDGNNTGNSANTIKSAIQGVTVGFDPSTKNPTYWVKGYQPDVFDGDQTRISQLDENLDLICDMMVTSGKAKNPWNGAGTSFTIDRLGNAYTNVDFYNDQGYERTGVLAIDPTACSSTLIMDYNAITLSGSFGGVTLAEDADGNLKVLAATPGYLHVYDMTSAQDTLFELGSGDSVSAAPVIDSDGRIIVMSNNNVMTLFNNINDKELTYGRNFWARPGKDNWGSYTAETVLP